MSPDSAALDGLTAASWDCNAGVNPEVVGRGMTDSFGPSAPAAHIVMDRLRELRKSSPDFQIAILIDGQPVASSAGRGP